MVICIWHFCRKKWSRHEANYHYKVWDAHEMNLKAWHQMTIQWQKFICPFLISWKLRECNLFCQFLWGAFMPSLFCLLHKLCCFVLLHNNPSSMVMIEDSWENNGKLLSSVYHWEYNEHNEEHHCQQSNNSNSLLSLRKE